MGSRNRRNGRLRRGGRPAAEPPLLPVRTEPPADAPPEPGGPGPDGGRTAFDGAWERHSRELHGLALLFTGGHRRHARRAVLHAFESAWADADPGLPRLRRELAEYALSPWWAWGGPRRVHRRHAALPVALVDPGDPRERQRAVALALHRLPRNRRRAMLLHETAGLSVPETAAEVEAREPAAAARIAAAHAELAEAVPELVGGDPADPAFRARLRAALHECAAHCGERLPGPEPVRQAARRRVAIATGSAGGAVLLICGLMAAVLVNGAQRVAPTGSTIDPLAAVARQQGPPDRHAGGDRRTHGAARPGHGRPAEDAVLPGRLPLHRLRAAAVWRPAPRGLLVALGERTPRHRPGR